MDTPDQDSTKAYQDFGEILKDTTLTEEEQMWYLNGLIEEEKQQLTKKQQTTSEENQAIQEEEQQTTVQDIPLSDKTQFYTKEEIEQAKQTGEYPKIMETHATTARIIDSYGIDEMQSPAQIQANIESLSSLPTDAECFEDDTFKDVKRVLDNIEIDRDITAESQSPNDLKLFCETVRMQTQMHLANTSSNGVKPEVFKQEYADRLLISLLSLSNVDLAAKQKPTQKSVSDLLNGMQNGKKQTIKASSFVGWQAAQHLEMNRATELMAKKPNCTQIVDHWKNNVKELNDKTQKKYPQVNSIIKTLGIPAGWGAAFGVASSLGPAAPAAVAALSIAAFANSTYHLVKDYKKQKEEHLKNGEQYNFFSYMKENPFRCAATCLSAVASVAGVGGLAAGYMHFNGAEQALLNTQAWTNVLRPFAMAGAVAEGAYKTAQHTWHHTEGPTWKKIWKSSVAAGKAIGAFTIGYFTGAGAGYIAGEALDVTIGVDTPTPQPQETTQTTQNTTAQTGQTLSSQTMQPNATNITMPVDTPSQAATPQIVESQMMRNSALAHESPTAPAHQATSLSAHESSTTHTHQTSEASTHESSASSIQENQTPKSEEMPESFNTGAYEGRLTESGISFVVNHETGEITTSGTTPDLEQAASDLAANSSLSLEDAQNILRDQEVFKDIGTRMFNGENVSKEEMTWARNHLSQIEEKGLHVNKDWSISPIQAEGSYENTDPSLNNNHSSDETEVSVQDTSVHKAGNVTYKFTEDGKLAIQGTSSSHLLVDDQQVTEFTENGKTMYRCGGSVSSNLQMAHDAEAIELKNIAAEHDIYNDLHAREAAGETLSQTEQNFIQRHEQKIQQHQLVTNEDGTLMTKAHAERVQTAATHGEQTNASSGEAVDPKATMNQAEQAGITLQNPKSVNLPKEYMQGNSNISIVCDQNHMIVSQHTPAGGTQSICATRSEDGKYTFQKIDENNHASPMSNEEIHAFQDNVLKPAAKAAESYHTKSGNHFDLSNSENISKLQTLSRHSSISK